MVLHLQIYGRVQGVYYRISTQKKAKELGLLGWVRNRKDGSVEVLARDPKAQDQQSSSALEELYTWCQVGPQLAKVEEIDRAWMRHPEDFVQFEILRT